MIKNVHRSSCKVPFFFPILTTLEFARHIFETSSEILNFMKISPVEAYLFHADGQTRRS